MNAHDTDHDLLGAYVLDALTVDEAVAFDAHLEACAACRTEAAELLQVVDVLPLACDMVEPPSSLRDRILSAIAAEEGPTTPRLTPLVGGAPRPAGRARFRWHVPAIVAAAAIVIAALGIWNVQLQRHVDDLQNKQALQADVYAAIASGARVYQVGGTPAARAATAAIVQSRNGGPAYFIVEGLPATPANKVYQLWLVRGTTPRSEGVFTYSGSSPQILALPTSTAGYAVTAVTIEPRPRGSLGPTGAKVLIGKLSA